jgi:aspartate racemase
MQTIGLIGGLSWESSAEYYKIINQTVQQKLGGVHSAKTLMYSFDFQEIKDLQYKGDWHTLTANMIEAAQALERGGSDFILICSNTMHKMVPEMQAVLHVPLLHIADPTGEEIIAAGMKKVGLLGTAFTMEHDFYRGRLADAFALEVITPDEAGRKIIHDVIYNELVKGIINPQSRKEYQRIIQDLADSGAEAVILGCTEIMLLIKEEDSVLPIFDTTTLHAVKAAMRAIG